MAKSSTSFGKGNCANPGGRPALPKEIREACQAVSLEAVLVLTDLMRNTAVKPVDRINACDKLLNRAYGTPPQAVEISGKDGDPFTHSLITVTFEK
jgi:hypothetical protein